MASERVTSFRLSFLSCFAFLLMVGGPAIAAKDFVAEAKAIYGTQLSGLIAQHEKEVARIPGEYTKALTSAIATAQGAGNFDLLMTLKKENSRFVSEKTIPKDASSDAPKLVQLQKRFAAMPKTFQVAHSKKVVTLATAYTKRLNDLKKGLTRTGDIDGATAAHAEIQRVSQSDDVTRASFILAEEDKLVAAAKPPKPAARGVPKAAPPRAVAGEPKGLVLHYDFKGLKHGKVADLSRKGNDGSIVGDVPVNGSATFTGRTHIAVPDDRSLDLSKSLSISVWVKATTHQNKGIVMKGGLGSSQGVYSLVLNPTSHGGGGLFRLNGGTADGEGQVSTKGSWSHHINTWTHLVGTYDGSSQKIYLNGKLSGTQRYSKPIRTDSADLIVGGYYSPGHLFQGQLDDLMIFDRALSGLEIGKLYTRQRK